MQQKFNIVCLVFTAFFFGFVFSVSAESATTTETITPQSDTTASTTSVTNTEQTIAGINTATTATNTAASNEALLQTPPSSLQPPQPEPIAPVPAPSAPAVQPAVPFQSIDGHAFDSATAPSKVTIKVLDHAGNVPTVPVFVTYVGVGGRTYGGPIDREGNLETIMPTGRYYADILVISTKEGPPPNPPSFFLDANENRDLGVLLLTDKSSFVDPSLEQEVASTLGDKESTSGFAKIFALIVKLLLAILKEIRGMRSELLGR